MLRRSSLLMVLCCALLVGCGAGPGEGDGETAGVVVPADDGDGGVAMDVEPDAPASDDDDGDGERRGSLPSGDCIALLTEFSRAQAGYAEAAGAAMSGGASDVEAVADTFAALAEAAPAEIRNDFEVMAEQLGSYFRGIAEIGMELGDTPTQAQMEQLGRLAEQLDQGALEAASERIEAYFEAACG
jgi:hypothetical protein